MRNDNANNRISKRRAIALVAVVAFMFGLYSMRLFQVQIVKGSSTQASRSALPPR